MGAGTSSTNNIVEHYWKRIRILHRVLSTPVQDFISLLFPYCSTTFLAPHINKLETYFAMLYFWTFAQCEKEMTTARLRQKCKKLSIHRGVTNKDCIRANKFKAFYFLQPIQLARKTFYETFKKCTKHLHKSFQSKENIAQMKTEKCLRYLLTLKDAGRRFQNEPLVRRLAAIHFKDTVARSSVQNYFWKVYSMYPIVASSNSRY